MWRQRDDSWSRRSVEGWNSAHFEPSASRINPQPEVFPKHCGMGRAELPGFAEGTAHLPNRGMASHDPASVSGSLDPSRRHSARNVTPADSKPGNPAGFPARAALGRNDNDSCRPSAADRESGFQTRSKLQWFQGSDSSRASRDMTHRSHRTLNGPCASPQSLFLRCSEGDRNFLLAYLKPS